MTRKFSFLPAFFIVLGVIFAAAVFLRVRAYQTADELRPALETTASATENIAGTTTASTDTGELVELAPDGTTIAPRDRSAAAAAREQRYNELLRSAPPAAPTQAATPQPEKSLLQKIVTPIANALGVGERKPAPAPVQPPVSVRAAPPQPQPQAQNNENRTNSRDANVDPEGPKDEESDTRPPQLMGLEFTPNQIADGAETNLILVVIDDLSGVRSVSGVISSPAGALQGFAGQREAPESNRYVARIQIPAEATAGTWRINYLALSDNAGNSVNLSAAQGLLPPTAQFRVNSAQSDSQGPTLKNVWVEKPAMRAGEKNTIFVEASDDKSGVSLASGVFVSPSKHARLGFGCRPGAGGTVWECDFTPAANVECGIWQLEQIQLQDKARNMATYRNDVPSVRAVQIDITGQGCDNTPPVLSALTLNPLVVSNAEGGVISVQAQVTDDMSGVAHINAQAYGPAGPSGPRISFSLASPDGGQNWIGQITVPKNAANGTWSVGWVQVIDKAQNLRAYSANDPVLANVKFRVE